jgi:hypothetical protein
MSEITEDKRTTSDAPMIVADYVDLLFDEEPILFYGLNSSGTPVFGTSVEWDRDNARMIFVHAVVEGYDAISFFNRQFDYSTLLQKARELFRVDKYYLKEGVDLSAVYRITWDEFPEKFRPMTGAMCPEKEEAAK